MNKILITLTAALSLSSIANAQTWNVDYGRSNTLRWTGVVDASTDTLTINSWDTSSVSTLYWNPVLPLVFNSITGAAGSEASYDIQSNWDGTFNNWGFLSADSINNITWAEGSTSVSAHMGWGVDDFRGLSQPSLGYTNDVGVMRNIAFDERTSLNEFSSVVITPISVPEPTSSLLLGLGALSVLVRRKR